MSTAMQVGAHYTPLVNQDAGPQTRNPLVPVLRFFLRIFNLALMAVGLTLLVGAIYMEIKYSRKPDGRPSPMPQPVPSPSPTAPAAPDLPGMPNFPPPPVPVSPVLESPSEVALGPSNQAPVPGFRRALLKPAMAARADGGMSVLASKAHPWFIWVVAASALYVTAVSSLGLTSMELHQRCGGSRLGISQVGHRFLSLSALTSLVLQAAPTELHRRSGRGHGVGSSASHRALHRQGPGSPHARCEELITHPFRCPASRYLFTLLRHRHRLLFPAPQRMRLDSGASA